MSGTTKLVFILAGFIVGALAARRYMPSLQRSREGDIGTWVVRVLVGAAVAVAFADLYDVAGAIGVIESKVAFSDGGTYLAAGIITSFLWQSGALLGLAVIIQYLGPSGKDGEEESS